VSASDPLDALQAALLLAGEDAAAVGALLTRQPLDEMQMVSLLRRVLPARALEWVGSTLPWATRPSVLAALVMNPRAPRTLAQRSLPSLRWRDLAEVARSGQVDGGVRVRAEALLRDGLPDLRLGDRITLARLATPSVLSRLLGDADPKVLGAALENPRLREADLLVALRRDSVGRALIEQAAASSRWRPSYAVGLELVQQGRTPLAVALAQLTRLRRRDLQRIAAMPGLAQLLRLAAARLAESPRHREPDA
jgi:hypothetical protein